MSVGFGFSVGDFLAALKLVGVVIDALRETSHASSSFRSLLDELYALESVLLRVKHLDLDDRHNVQKLALWQAASQCQRTIDAFWKDTQKYQPHLQQSGTDSRIRDGWVKIKWAVCKKSDLEVFRAQIRGHTSSIEILLLTVHLEVTTLEARKQESHNKGLSSKIQSFSFQVMGKLAAISSSIGQSLQQGKALLESSAQIIQTNVRVFQMLHDIQLFIFKIPGQIQRQQPVYLIDAFNKASPFHLEFIRSAEALLAVLKVNFKTSGCDPGIIDRREFVIEESGTQISIDLTGPWDGCFYPGQKVAMSVIFKQGTSPQTTCPRCGKDHEGLPSQEIICVTCGTIFRRIEELIENVKDEGQAMHFGDESSQKPGNVSERPVIGPARQLKKHRKEHQARTTIQKFRRIRLISSIIDDRDNKLETLHLLSWEPFDLEMRAYTQRIEDLFDLTDALMILKKDALSAYLVGAKQHGVHGYWLFSDTLKWCQLVGWTLERAVSNIRSGPVPRVEGNRIHARPETISSPSDSLGSSPAPWTTMADELNDSDGSDDSDDSEDSEDSEDSDDSDDSDDSEDSDDSDDSGDSDDSEDSSDSEDSTDSEDSEDSEF